MWSDIIHGFPWLTPACTFHPDTLCTLLPTCPPLWFHSHCLPPFSPMVFHSPITNPCFALTPFLPFWVPQWCLVLLFRLSLLTCVAHFSAVPCTTLQFLAFLTNGLLFPTPLTLPPPYLLVNCCSHCIHWNILHLRVVCCTRALRSYWCFSCATHSVSLDCHTDIILQSVFFVSST